MKKQVFLFSVLLFIGFTVHAQETYEEYKKRVENSFSDFRNSKMSDYETYRKRINQEYVNLLKSSWIEIKSIEAKSQPIEEKRVIPVVISDEEQRKPIKNASLSIATVVPKAVPQPQPQPEVPIEVKSTPTLAVTPLTFTFAGTRFSVSDSTIGDWALRGVNEKEIARVWNVLADGRCDRLLSECLSIRKKYRLSDWAYLMTLYSLSKTMYTTPNEANLLTAYLYSQSGYKMRLATANSRVYLLYASNHVIYNKSFWTIDGSRYYPLDCYDKSLYISQASFPNEKALSLIITENQAFDVALSDTRLLQSKRYPSIKVTMQTNRNLMKFYDTYPTSCINNDFMTKWAMIANTPLDEHCVKQLYPVLRQEIQGQSELQKVERLLNFVQTAFTYELDDKVWGHDRAFFAEETLNYPYSDCEDRSILFSRLVRDLVGLDVILIYYPGHLATAVQFTQQVNGDYIMLNGKRFIVCDPTYIGASAGRSMPNVDKSNIKVFLL